MKNFLSIILILICSISSSQSLEEDYSGSWDVKYESWSKVYHGKWMTKKDYPNNGITHEISSDNKVSFSFNHTKKEITISDADKSGKEELIFNFTLIPKDDKLFYRSPYNVSGRIYNVYQSSTNHFARVVLSSDRVTVEFLLNFEENIPSDIHHRFDNTETIFIFEKD
tara:strand:- start:1942 stop:2445 length:504 start_codon:yes stop_codon:yes gene_type:complete